MQNYSWSSCLGIFISMPPLLSVQLAGQRDAHLNHSLCHQMIPCVILEQARENMIINLLAE